jgi:ribokinase
MDVTMQVAALPQAGETVLATRTERALGGKGLNQAVAARRMGAEVRFIAATGNDDAGALIRERSKAEGIDIAHLHRREDVSTGVASIARDASGANTIIVDPGANGSLASQDIDAARETIAWADVVLLQLEIPMTAVVRAAIVARECGTSVMLNAAPATTLPSELLSSIDVLILNETEARTIGAGRPLSRLTQAPASDVPAGVPSRVMDLLSRLIGLGVPYVIVTAGADGCVHASNATPTWVPSFAVEAIDTVGAGDAFCGVLAARWAEHQAGGGLDITAIRDALDWASAAGALACTKPGAADAMPMRDTIRSLLLKR